MAQMIQVPDLTKRYFTSDDNASLIYFQFPKLLMYGEKYKPMSSDGKLFYMLCLDLITLSMKKGWKDEYGRYYIKMSLETIKDRMNCQNTKAVNLKKELIEYGLMEVVRIGQGKADRLYILQLDYTSEDIYRANNDHEGIENDEDVISENLGALQPQENSENQSSRTLKSGELELRKSETIKNLSIKNNELRTNPNNPDIENMDDDKRTPPDGGDSANHNEEAINLLISNFREATKDELVERSFKSVVQKVVDKYNQGKIGEGKFRDYLVTSLVNKIENLEIRRQKENAKQQIKASPGRNIADKLHDLEIREIPLYNWLED